MKEYQKEMVSLSARELLLSIFDLTLPFFEAHHVYRASARKYWQVRKNERSNYTQRMQYLRRHGLIERFVEGKEVFWEITPKGIDRINKYHLNNPVINRPDKWDEKWRVVIFDVPDKRKTSRDMLRNKLLKLGFEKVQESVYVHPFECAEAIATISAELLVEDSVLVMISEIIRGENYIIEKFLDKGTLTKADLKT
ncbi:MAG TPA: CRISPR-associated endonuclease Cas2 [bacterium]|nr:CRISPR-associated endonuclease Cas2 [bacterium]